MSDIRIGTTGWSIPRASAFRVDPSGTHLQRYAGRFRCVEINSSFYRAHAPATYGRWHDATPPDFRFAVKMPRSITHEQALRAARQPLTAFLAEIEGLAEKRGPILVQLPPSLSFDVAVARRFFDLVRRHFHGPLVCEPRHATWFSPRVASLLHGYEVARVAADPPCVPEAAVPGGWPRVAYFRLHGSPRTYWSRYDATYIASLATALRSLPQADQVWCVFDNTASGSAIENAWELRERLAGADG